MNYNQLFADHFKALREEMGLSQEAMAEVLSVPRETLSKYETAKRGITLKTLLKMAGRLKIDPSKLLPKIPLG